MIGNLAIFWPMIAQAFLTFAIYVVLLRRRIGAVRHDGSDAAAFRRAGREPKRSLSAQRNLSNQFELPVLFFAVCLALYVTNGASWLAVAVAWIFVLSRIAHAFVHLTENRLRPRMRTFFVGFGAAVVLWLLFALHLAGAA